MNEETMSKKPLGVLILHGFTSSLDTVNGLASPLEALKLPYRMPILRGHGAESPEALCGVTWHDWVADAEKALEDLLTEVDKVIVCGFSMGGAVALVLATGKQKGAIDSIVTASVGVKAVSPLAPGRPLSFLKPLVTTFLKKWDFPPVYADPELVKFDTNYKWAPMDSVLSLLDLMQVVEQILPEIKHPILIMHSRIDTLAHPESAEIIYKGISTSAENKQLVWFEKTNHEIFLDCERDAAIKTVVDYVKVRMAVREKVYA